MISRSTILNFNLNSKTTGTQKLNREKTMLDYEEKLEHVGHDLEFGLTDNENIDFVCKTCNKTLYTHVKPKPRGCCQVCGKAIGKNKRGRMGIRCPNGHPYSPSQEDVLALWHKDPRRKEKQHESRKRQRSQTGGERCGDMTASLIPWGS
jgi:hypothetical protein